jgi:hypothetical protein
MKTERLLARRVSSGKVGGAYATPTYLWDTDRASEKFGRKFETMT